MATSILQTTSTVSYTPSPTLIKPFLTLTPKPSSTLTDTEIQQKILELLETNNNCNLPCWWGITPGITDKGSLLGFLLPLARWVDIYEEEPVRISLSFLVPKEIYPILLTQDFTLENEIVTMIEANPGNIHQYQFANLLREFGNPEETWLLTFNAGESEEIRTSFDLYFYYPSQGILMRFVQEAEFVGENVKICPLSTTQAGGLVLLPPDQNLPFRDLVSLSQIKLEPSYILPILEGTAMQVSGAELYQYYQDLDNTTALCFETPQNIWPER